MATTASRPLLPSPGQSAVDLLVSYAAFHRDRRNIQTHLVGIPLTLLALGILLGRPNWSLGAMSLSPAWLCFSGVAAWYLTRGHLRLGLAASAAVGLLVAVSERALAFGLAPSWTLGAALLAVGLSLQAAGHYYEGRRPASLGHPLHLLVGPMFVTLEVLAGFGFLRQLASEVQRRAGPVHVRDLAHPMAHR